MKLAVNEFRLRIVSLGVWFIGVAALVSVIAAVYPSIAGQHSLDSIYANLSPAAQALLGGSDLTSPVGYLRTQLFAFFLPAVLLVFTVARAATSVAGEEEQRTLDLLLAQPLSRASLYLAKSSALTAAVVVMSLASWLPLVLLDNRADLHLSVGSLTAQCVQMGLLLLTAALWTQAVASWTGRRASGTGVVVGYLVLAYVIDGLATSVGWLGPTRPLTIWRWYSGNDALTHGLGGLEAGVLATVAVLGLGAGLWAFGRRNLRA